MSAEQNDAKNPFKDSMNFFQNLKAPGINLEAAAASHRKNVEVLTEAQKTTAEVFKTLVGLNSQYLKQTFEEAGNHAHGLASAENLEDKTKTQVNYFKNHVSNALNHGRELANTLSQSTNKLFDICAKRFQDGVDETQEILKPAANTSSGRPR